MRILLPLLCVTAACAQNDVNLRLLNPHPFHQGELMAAELKLPPQWYLAGILLDPPGTCGTEAQPCFLNDAGGISPGGLAGNGPQGVSDRRDVTLNSYLPLLAPGRYGVSVLAQKAAGPAEHAVSNRVEIEIVPATADWVRQTVAAGLATLNGPQPRDGSAYQKQRDAALQLSFLNDPAAWSASLDLLPKEEGVLLAGLARGRPAAQVCDLMQTRVSAPTQSVSTGYLYRMSEICARANLPPMPHPPAAAATRPKAIVGVLSATPPPAGAPVLQPDPEMEAWVAKWRVYTEGVRSKAAAALAGSLANKQPPARWDAFATLLQEIAQVRVNRPPQPDPAWIPLLTREFVQDFPKVETARQQYLLDMFASTVDSPELEPLLESILDGWKPGDYYEAPHSALRALHRIHPARARARILAELSRDKTWLDTASLAMLPPSAVPPMDDALIESLARAQRPGGWNQQLSMAAIARYATPEALPRIRAIYESQQDQCQPELVAYFVRVDPSYADRIFHSHPWDMHVQPPRCTVQYFNRTAPLAMGPPLERYMAAYLMHGDVYIKSAAAQALGRYGTSAALPPLWEAFRYFHNYWNGKGAELAQNGQGVGLEVDLRSAIARGRGWLATETDLHLIESLCISDRCIAETRQDLENLKPPLRIEITPQPSLGLFGRIGQYYGLEGVAAVESKLAQFPRGTGFVLYAPGGPSGTVAGEIRRFAASQGLVVTVE